MRARCDGVSYYPVLGNSEFVVLKLCGAQLLNRCRVEICVAVYNISGVWAKFVCVDVFQTLTSFLCLW